jgi:ATP phosphoribosyltransferase
VEVILKVKFFVSPKSKSRISKIIDTLKFRIESVLRARKSKYILMNVLMIKLKKLVKFFLFTQLNCVAIGTRRLGSVHSVIDKDTFGMLSIN